MMRLFSLSTTSLLAQQNSLIEFVSLSDVHYDTQNAFNLASNEGISQACHFALSMFCP